MCISICFTYLSINLIIIFNIIHLVNWPINVRKLAKCPPQFLKVQSDVFKCLVLSVQLKDIHCNMMWDIKQREKSIFERLRTEAVTGAVCVPTNGTEGMAELQVKSIDGHLITDRQHSHGGEVAGGVGDISTGCHTGQTQA